MSTKRTEYLEITRDKAKAFELFRTIAAQVSPQIKALDELRRQESSKAEAEPDEAEFQQFCRIQAKFVQKRIQLDKRAKREQEFFTRRGPVRKWYQDELCQGLPLELAAEVDAFVDTNCPSLNEALIQDYSAQELQIELKRGVSDVLVPLSKADQAALRRRIRDHRAAMNKAYAIAGRLGEIGRVEHFVLELRGREE